jgi:cysteinyl-tRNA synthetase
MIHENILSTIGNTPLVRINHLNPNPKVSVLAKIEYFNPGGSIKDRVGMAMIEAAERDGLLAPGKTIIEATSGNTGIGLAMVCAVKGYKLKLLMPSTASEERKKILLAYGAEIHLTPGHQGTDGAIEEAYRLAREEPDKYALMDQFNNPASIEAHYAETGREIWEQTQGKVTHVVIALGTSGTVMGVTKRLKELAKAAGSEVCVVAVEPYAGHKIQGLKNMQESYPPGIYDKKALDRIVRVEDELAFETARRMAREEGLLVGMSSGAAVAGAVSIAQELREGLIVAIVPDSGERYLSTKLFAAPAKQGVTLRNQATGADAAIETAPGGAGLYTMGPALDQLEDLDAWRRIALLDILAGHLETRGVKVALGVGLADLDDRAMQAGRDAGLAPSAFTERALTRIAALAKLLGVSQRAVFYPASASVKTAIELSRKLLAKGAAYEKLRSVYFDVLRCDKYGQLSAMDMEKISLGKTVDLEAYVKDNPKDFTLLKRASLQDLKRGDCLQTEWGNVRPSWFLQLAAVGLDRLPALSVFMASETHCFPHLENFRGIWSLGRGVEPQAWLVCRGAHASEELAGQPLEQLLSDETTRRAFRMWLLSASYHKPLAWSEASLAMWRKNWSRVQNLAVALAEQAARQPVEPGKKGGRLSGPAAPALRPEIDQALLDLKNGRREAMENDLSLHRFWHALFKFCRDARHWLDDPAKEPAAAFTPAEASACLHELRAVDATFGILDPTRMPLPRASWPAVAAALVPEREQARKVKNFDRADSLREAILAAGFRVEDTAEGPRLYPV